MSLKTIILSTVIALLAAPYVLATMPNDEWLPQVDDLLPNGLPLIHEYVLYTFGPK